MIYFDTLQIQTLYGLQWTPCKSILQGNDPVQITEIGGNSIEKSLKMFILCWYVDICAEKYDLYLFCIPYFRE